MKDSHRGIFLNKANESWKKFKSTLRANFVGDDFSKWKEKVPPLVKSKDWEIFCDHKATENQKQIRIQNKANKLNCERKGSHNTDRDGYARSAEKWEEVNGRPPSRAELWLATHSLKDGTYAPYNKKFAVCICVNKIFVLLNYSFCLLVHKLSFFICRINLNFF